MKLTKEYLDNWLNDLKNDWLNKDIKKAVSYFSGVQKYYENIFWEPTNDIGEITKFWQEIKNQEIKELNFNIVAIENNVAVVNWIFSFIEKEEINLNGIYVINFDDNLNCIEFRQWAEKK